MSDLTPIAHTTTEAAKLLRRSPSTLEHWRLLGIGPPFIRNPGGTGILYSHAGLISWLAEQEKIEVQRRRVPGKRARAIRATR